MTTETLRPTKTADRTLALFDFDGTITTRDTLIEFVHFYRGKPKFWLGMAMLAPTMAMYKIGLMPNWKAKQFFLAQYFKDEMAEVFNQRCRDFADQKLPNLLRPGALAAIEDYKRTGATIAVVSASAENWVKPWCDKLGILCLSTRLEVVEGRITGNILGKNCYGDEKACRIRESFDLSEFKHIVAYGDSSGDKEMLELAHEKHYKPWRD